MQAYIAVRQHVFFHHIGQVIGCGLALFGQPVKTPGQQLNHQRYRREQERDDQHQFPVEVNQITDQCHQRQHIARQFHDGIVQDDGAVVDLVHHSVRYSAGRLVRKQRKARAQQFVKHGLAQRLQPFIRHLGQGVLCNKARQPPDSEQQQERDRNQPEIKRTLLEPPVKQWLE